MKIKVSNLIANFFAEKNMNDIFMVTGGGAMHLDDSLGHHPDLKIIFNHHEQACAIAAEGYAKYSGKLPVVSVTSGPGGTNAITGVLCAFQDSIPMFLVSGQVKRITTINASKLNIRQIGDQEFDIVNSVQNMTKYAVIVNEPLDILYHLQKAHFLATNGRPGPVWIDVPLDVQAAIVETDQLLRYDDLENWSENPPFPNSSQIDLFMQKLHEAKRPVIIVGSGVRIAKAHMQFIEFIEHLGIPVVTAWNAHDSLWDEHPLYCGRPGTIGTRGGNFIVQNSDMLIAIGSRLNIRQISYNYDRFANNAFKVMVDIDANEMLKHTLKIDLKILANVKEFMEMICKIDYVNNLQQIEWLKWCREVNDKYPAVIESFYNNKAYINPYVMLDEFINMLPENEPIVASNGSACVISFQVAKLKRGQRLFANSGTAPMGYGLPAAIGVAEYLKDRRVICIEGDGSLQMNIQELQTIVYNDYDIKILVINNNGYHSIRQTQNNVFNPPLIGVNKDNGISFPNLEKISFAYGLKYMCIKQIEDIKEVIYKLLNEKGPTIIEAFVDENQYFEPKLSSKVLEDGSIVSPEIDDMFPFLSREEYDSNKFN